MTHASRHIGFGWRHVTSTVAVLAGAGLAAVILAACSQQPQQQVPLVDTGAPALHAVSNAELRKAMVELNRQAGGDFRLQLYVGTKATVDMSEVAKAAESMAATAEDIPKAAAGLDLDQAEREMFVKLAMKLRDQARMLRTEAERNDQRAAQATMNRIMTTCNSCHASFRLGAAHSG